MQKPYPVMFHPCNVLFLDDDRRFLNALVSELPEDLAFVLQDDPHKALDYLQGHVIHADAVAQRIAEQDFDQLPDQQHLKAENYSINISRLQGDLASAERFKQITTVVVDRHMPAMDGLEFCRIVREEEKLPVKLILLTGATTVDEAVTAFNSGKIDGFIEKTTEEDMPVQLNQMLHRLTWQQFAEISEQVMGLIRHQFSHVFDDKFFEVFDEVRNTHQIVEFYLLDSSGSFLMLDKQGQAKILLVRVDADFDMMYELAKDSDALRDVLQSLHDRQRYPFTLSGMGHLLLKGDAWNAIMVPMHKVPGRDVFYSVNDLIDLDTISFEQYCDQIWPQP